MSGWLKEKMVHTGLKTKGILNALSKISSGLIYETVELEVSFALGKKGGRAFNRMNRCLRICVEYGYAEEIPALQLGFKAYRITDRGRVFLDTSLLRS